MVPMSEPLDPNIDAIAEAVAAKLSAPIMEMLRATAIRALGGGKAVLPRPEAALFLGLSPRTLEAWSSQGKGPRETRLGRARGHTLEALIEYSDAHQGPSELSQEGSGA
jgi:hypothetical protein